MTKNHRKILTFEGTRVFVVVHTKRQSNQTCSLNVSFSIPKIMNFGYAALRLKHSPNTNPGNIKKKKGLIGLAFSRVLVLWFYRYGHAAAFTSHCSLSYLLLTPDTESHGWNALQFLFHCLYLSSSHKYLLVWEFPCIISVLQIKGRTDR